MRLPMLSGAGLAVGLAACSVVPGAGSLVSGDVDAQVCAPLSADGTTTFDFQELSNPGRVDVRVSSVELIAPQHVWLAGYYLHSRSSALPPMGAAFLPMNSLDAVVAPGETKVLVLGLAGDGTAGSTRGAWVYYSYGSKRDRVTAPARHRVVPRGQVCEISEFAAD